MAPTNPSGNWCPPLPRQPLPPLTTETPSRNSEGDSPNNAVGVSTVSSDYKLQVSASNPGVPQRTESVPGSPAALPVPGGQMEVEDGAKGRAFAAPKQSIKNCIRSYQALSQKTRQTLKIAGIGIASVLAIVTIFYVARLSEHNPSKGEIVFMQHEVENKLELKIAPNAFSSMENEPPQSDPDTFSNIKDGTPQPDSELTPAKPEFKIKKNAHGKANQYGMYPRRKAPLFPHIDIERVKARRNYWHVAEETEIAETLTRVRKMVDADRKKIVNKELRFWEQGDQPLRVLLVSTWRSGSTFFGQMLQAHPGVFQHFEPLSYIGMHQVRSGKEAFQAQQLLHRLLDCKYDDLENYMNHTKSNMVEVMGHNTNVWESCVEGPNKMACSSPNFLSSACKMFPIQLVKTVRLRLNLTQLLLNDQKLRVKVLFLVRDPRGIMSSRYSSVDWCSSSPDCESPDSLCQDMQGDLKVAAAFEKLYPDRFLKVKYEDLSSQPQEEASKVLSFLGLEFSDSVKKYIEVNTNTDIDTPWSTQRKSGDRIAIWKKNMPLEEIHAVQNACGAVMKTLKYELT